MLEILGGYDQKWLNLIRAFSFASVIACFNSGRTFATDSDCCLLRCSTLNSWLPLSLQGVECPDLKATDVGSVPVSDRIRR